MRLYGKKIGDKHIHVCIWIGILLVAAFFRFYKLGMVPMGVTNDELGYIFNAYSIGHTGRNVFGQLFPLFTYFGHGFPFMPVPTYLGSLVFLFLPLSAFAGRLPNALLGVGAVVLLGWLTQKLTKNKLLSYTVALSLAISPWHIFFSRTAYDAPVAAFFYLAFFASAVQMLGRARFSLWPCIWLLLGLFSYRGMTPVAPGLVLLASWYGWRVVNGSKRLIGTLLASCVVLLMIFGYVAISQQSKGFIAEGTVNVQEMEKTIEYSMRETQGPHWVKRIYMNKPMSLVTQWAQRYVSGYDPGVLFLHGEGSQIYSMWMRGKWYAVDIVVMLVGFIYLFRTPSLFSFGVIAMSLFMIGGLPGLVGGAPYGARNFFLTIAGAVFAGSGWVALMQSKRWQKGVVCLLIIMYAYSASHFLFDYFERYAQQRSEDWFYSMKEVSTTLEKESQRRTVVWAGGSFFDFLQFAFYTHITPQDVQQVQKNGQLGVYRWKSIVVAGECTPIYLSTIVDDSNPVFIVRDNCWKAIQSPKQIRDFQKNSLWHILDRPL